MALKKQLLILLHFHRGYSTLHPLAPSHCLPGLPLQSLWILRPLYPATHSLNQHWYVLSSPISQKPYLSQCHAQCPVHNTCLIHIYDWISDKNTRWASSAPCPGIPPGEGGGKFCNTAWGQSPAPTKASYSSKPRSETVTPAMKMLTQTSHQCAKGARETSVVKYPFNQVTYLSLCIFREKLSQETSNKWKER